MLTPPAEDQQRYECRCPEPNQHPDPRRPNTCVNVHCMGFIDPNWTSNDRTVGEWFKRLGESMFRHDQFTGELLTSKAFDAFRDHCEARERAGRERFGNTFHGRQNLEEAREEIADLALYSLLDSLVIVRKEGRDADVDLALTMAFHAFKAYEASLRLQGKRDASTGPGWDDP